MQVDQDEERQARTAPGADEGTAKVRILRTVEEIEEVRGFWASWPGTRDSDIDLLLAACGAGSKRRCPHILVLYRGEKPVALIAGSISLRRVPFGVGDFRLFNPIAKVLDIPYGGLRGGASAEDCDRSVREIVDTLRKGEADVAVFSYLNTESDLYRCVRQTPSFACRDRFVRVLPHYKRILAKNAEIHDRELSANQKKEFRRATKRIERDFSGRVSLEMIQDPIALDQTLQVIEEIARKTWQRRVGGGLNINDPTLAQLMAEAERGWLRVYVLRLGGNACAFWTGTVYQNVFYSNYIGFDPGYADYSPGTYMLFRILEDLSSHGVEAFDFGWGPEEYKKRFGNLTCQAATAHIYAPAFKGIRLSLMKTMTGALRDLAKHVVRLAGLKEARVRSWRHAGQRERRNRKP
jgi:hypothetical protein